MIHKIGVGLGAPTIPKELKAVRLSDSLTLNLNF